MDDVNIEKIDLTKMCYGKGDCRWGCCWHEYERRRRERMSKITTRGACDFSAPIPKEKKPKKPTKKELLEMELERDRKDAEAAKRRDEWYANHPLVERCGPDSIKRHPLGYPAGVGCVGYPDIDGTGSWGSHVRCWEDRGDFQDDRENWSG